MAFLLCLETATTVCSVALFENETLLAFQEYHLEKSHSSLLPSIIDSTLKHSAVSRSALSAVAVSEGPGSYTGLRIGVSAAKGLSYALEIPMVSVNTLTAMAAGVNVYNKERALLCPMIDARRMEVYTGVFDFQNELVQEIAPMIIDENSFSDLLETGNIWFFGDGAGKCKEVLRHRSSAFFIEGVVPSARFMGGLAFQKFKRGDFADLAYFEPFYLKEFRITKPKSSQ